MARNFFHRFETRAQAWAFMRLVEAKGGAAGFPQSVDGVWTVRTLV